MAASVALIVVTAHPWPAMPALVSVLALVALRTGGIPFAVVLRAVTVPALMLTVVALPIAVSADAERWVRIDADGVTTAGMAAARGASALLITMGLALTTPMTDLAWLLARGRVPRGLVDVLLGTYRFFLTLDQTRQALCTAQRARLGFSGWSGTIRSTGRVAGALFGRTMDRALGLERGLCARGGVPDWRSEGMPLSLGVCTALTLGSVAVLTMAEVMR